MIALADAIGAGRERMAAREEGIAQGEPGFYLEFSMPIAEISAVEGLENRPKKIELVAVQPTADDAGSVAATVFVPERASEFFLRKVEAYRDEHTPTGQPKNANLVTRIDTVRIGAARSLFTDSPEYFPPRNRVIWWETWLRKGRRHVFANVAERLNIRTKGHAIDFPERDVVLALADIAGIERLIRNSDAVAELRIAKDTPRIFLEMNTLEQAEWARDVQDRLIGPPADAPSICIMDSGATQGHPLIAPALNAADQHTYNDQWGVGDSAFWKGHGTAMAGVVAYADLAATLAGNGIVTLQHRLETVKILPPAAQNDPDLYGAITTDSVARVELAAPNRRRAFCMAITSDVGLGRGRPSSWSAAVDQLCFGEGNTRRLMVLSIGNLRGDIDAADYLNRNDLEEAENPSQAWNPLVVSAYTDKVTITDPAYAGWQCVAPAGNLCPTSRTSGIWERQWPIRPDVLMEGGNLAHDGVSPASAIDDLQLVSTHYRPNVRLFEAFGDTSAAAGIAANLGAAIMSRRPELWPETVRALIVHSAEWTPAMRGQFEAAGSQAHKFAMLRRYGYGVADLERSLLSAANDATLIIQDSLIPYRIDGSTIKTRDMNVHSLPWPREELEALGQMNVELRVTLSYFVEPNPGERGWVRRHRYASHGLRFTMKRSLETIDGFRRRINAAVPAEEDELPAQAYGEDNWLLGPIRDRGSVHSDIWRGSAAELAQRDAIGILPIGGWWKEKRNLERWGRPVHYALTLSIRALDSEEVDIYTAITNQIAIQVPAR